jgi:Helix-turn-helix domain
VAQRPEYLTVPEVMARLRLGRTTVYEQARLYLATGGAEGIPCRRFGRSLRFPAAAFDTAGADSGRAAERGAEVVALTDVRRRHAPTVDRKLLATRRPTRRTRGATGTDQSSLPFTD